MEKLLLVIAIIIGVATFSIGFSYGVEKSQGMIQETAYKKAR